MAEICPQCLSERAVYCLRHEAWYCELCEALCPDCGNEWADEEDEDE